MADADPNGATITAPQGTQPDGLQVGAWSFRFDTRTGTGPDGRGRRITPKNLAVLRALAARAGETVSKETLLEENWPGRWPTEQVLARCIADLRRLFQDDPRSPTYIETIPKLGYRLIADVGALKVRGGPSPPARRPTRWQWTTAGIAAALVVAIVWWPEDPAPRPVQSGRAFGQPGDLLPETSGAGVETAVDYASDGAMAYARTLPDGNAWSIVVSDAGRTSTRIVDYAPDSLFAPVFSPAADRLAMLRFSDSACSVNVMPLDTLNPLPLARCTARFYTTLDWSPRDDWLAYTTDRAADDAGRRSLHLVDPRTGQKHRLTAPPSTEHTDYNPRFSPEGARVAYMRGTMSPQHHVDLYLTELAGNTTRRLTFDDAMMGGLDWISDREIAFSSNRDGAWAIWILDVPDARLTRLSSLRVRRPVYDPSRGMLVFTLSDWDRDLVSIRLGEDGDPRPVADSTRQDWQPDVSPDGNTLVFVSNRSGHTELWRVRPGVTEARQLTQLSGPSVAWPRLRPGADDIALVVNDGAPQVMRWTPDAGLDALFHPWEATTTPAWQPDGKALALGCQIGGQWRICRLQPGRDVGDVLTQPNTYHPSYSGDGRWLYYVDGDAALWRQSSSGGTAELVTADLPSQSASAWRVMNGQIFFLHPGDDAHAPGLYRLTPGSHRPVLERALAAETVNASLAMDASGQVFVALTRPPADDLMALPIGEIVQRR